MEAAAEKKGEKERKWGACANHDDATDARVPILKALVI
jgi:hypothetical protein